MRISFIGGGNMGEAMLSAILNKLPAPHNIAVSDVSNVRRLYIKQTYSGKDTNTSVKVTASNLEAVKNADVTVLAIKPQNLAAVMAGLNGQLENSQLVLSIIAGARIEALHKGLGHNSIIRVMPNTPAQIGEGMSVWTATAEVTGEQRKQAKDILGAMGKEIYVDDERYIDMATAVSGSGPAYVFLFMEALVEAGVHIGLPRETSYELVAQTLLGSARFAVKSGKPLAELRRMVTSPGGTTAEAIARFEEGKFQELILKAVIAAHEKAKKLGA